jgi:hypothetical protein
MGPKKPKKTKAELEEEKLAHEEEQRKAKIAEEKRIAEDNEKRRLEELRIQAEHKKSREAELERLNAEFAEVTDELTSAQQQLVAEEKRNVSICSFLQRRSFAPTYLLPRPAYGIWHMAYGIFFPLSSNVLLCMHIERAHRVAPVQGPHRRAGRRQRTRHEHIYLSDSRNQRVRPAPDDGLDQAGGADLAAGDGCVE